MARYLIPCPDCGGEGEHVLGPLRFLCGFCHGTGEVGGDNEPAERGEHPGFNPYTDPSPVWEATLASLPVCTMCFGAGTVVNVGDIRAPTRLIESACPACSPRRGEPGTRR